MASPSSSPSFLYLSTPGTMLRQAGRRLALERQDRTLADIPVFSLSAIFVYGAVRVTTHAIHRKRQSKPILKDLAKTA